MTNLSPNFDALPDCALLTGAQLVRSPKRPTATPVLPFSLATLMRKVAAGTFPPPVKLSARMTCWRVSDVRQWLGAVGVSA